MSEGGVNIIYGILALLAAIMMFVPKKGIDNIPLNQVKFNKWLAALLAFVIGIGAGIVGAGGSFSISTDYASCFKDPYKNDNCFLFSHHFSLIDRIRYWKVSTGQVEYLPALIIVIASIIASPIGAKIGKNTNTKVLQVILSILIFVTAAKIWLDIL